MLTDKSASFPSAHSVAAIVTSIECDSCRSRGKVMYLLSGWPGTVDWAGATAPTLTASGVDTLVFYTIDGGTIWYGFLAGADMS